MLIIAGLLGIFTILAQNYNQLSVAIFGSEDAIKVLTPIHEWLASLLHTLDEFEITAKLIPVFLWYLVGMVLFTVVQTIARDIRQSEKNLEIAFAWHKAAGYTPLKYWSNIFLRSLIRASFGLLAIGCVALLVLILLPLSALTTEVAVQDSSAWERIARFGSIWIVLTLAYWGIFEGIHFFRVTRRQA